MRDSMIIILPSLHVQICQGSYEKRWFCWNKRCVLIRSIGMWCMVWENCTRINWCIELPRSFHLFFFKRKKAYRSIFISTIILTWRDEEIWSMHVLVSNFLLLLLLLTTTKDNKTRDDKTGERVSRDSSFNLN